MIASVPESADRRSAGRPIIGTMMAIRLVG